MTTIATNPDTGIRYYSDPGPQEGASADLFVTIRGDSVTNPGGTHWPNLFGAPYEEPGLAFYLKTPPKIREYDDRIFYENATWGPVDYVERLPGGPHGTWEEALEVIKRSEEELLNQVEAARLQASARLYPTNQDPMLRELLAEARAREEAGTATMEMQELLARQQMIIDAGFTNLERAAVLKKQIKEGKPFDLTAGWVNDLS
jgi:hypothetical protein